MDLLELLTLPAKYRKLEEEHVEIMKCLIRVLDAIEVQDLQYRELLCAYQSHLYHNYHGVETLKGDITFSKPKITMEEDIALAKLKLEITKEIEAKMMTKLRHDTQDL